MSRFNKKQTSYLTALLECILCTSPAQYKFAWLENCIYSIGTDYTAVYRYITLLSAAGPGSFGTTSERTSASTLYACTHTQVHTHVHTRARTHTHTHTHAHTHTHTHTHNSQ